MTAAVPRAVTSEVVASLGMAKVFKDYEDRVNSIDFHEQGGLLVAASDDESIHLYDANRGEAKKLLYSKKYGVDVIRFTHDGRPGRRSTPWHAGERKSHKRTVSSSAAERKESSRGDIATATTASRWPAPAAQHKCV